jgi:hypothetical protein
VLLVAAGSRSALVECTMIGCAVVVTGGATCVFERTTIAHSERALRAALEGVPADEEAAAAGYATGPAALPRPIASPPPTLLRDALARGSPLEGMQDSAAAAGSVRVSGEGSRGFFWRCTMRADGPALTVDGAGTAEADDCIVGAARGAALCVDAHGTARVRNSDLACMDGVGVSAAGAQSRTCLERCAFDACSNGPFSVCADAVLHLDTVVHCGSAASPTTPHL